MLNCVEIVITALENATSKMADYYVPISDQPYLTMYKFEQMDLPFWRQWFADNWHYSVYVGVIYLTFIFTCQRVMKNREPFDLKRPLAIWNLGFSAFSLFAFTRVFPEILYLLRKSNGLHAAACKM